eukprot:gb/GECG01015573.1/.p1 GENE.gb/GECG01015573.1/~~gb/GECG01015573.1/.p1  ORF type:complete len:185 (+),score=13.02 gb/GECG01015573.1/:1-555(+)
MLSRGGRALGSRAFRSTACSPIQTIQACFKRHQSSLTEQDVSPTIGENDTVIHGMDDFGYQVNGIYMRGSVLCFPNFTLLWDVGKVTEITPQNLSPILIVRPRIEMLLIGTGEEMKEVNPILFGHFARNGVAVEHMASKHAISTFNVLNQEGRGVAAALLCRTELPRDEWCCYLRGSPDMIKPE